MAVVPYKDSDAPKKKQVAEMFNNISGRYDLLNHTLSFHVDKYWRKKTIRILSKYTPETILDIATGTADFAIEACKINPQKVTGIDISKGMLEIGRKKIIKKKLTDKIELMVADSENLPFEDNTFDSSVAGFGVRNFEDIEKGLSEVLRVLKIGGWFLILEFSKPQSGIFKMLYGFYFKRILPFIGKIVSKDRSAYLYLHDSVSEFPSGKKFEDILKRVGFVNISSVPLTFGIATIYKGQKSKSF
ncbi:MAG: bifunctional demethylmenaquinone methyltransferase/2-methoxy-6-polyprenyl-1,4-benzoquinol methylase UbiE [Prolixibacteraceae bacterium]|nr:bifunctional demethylmenaquinone methyltransferase/2-methoxy-6-polyprenyl-1,4-benzoquinol methylase UbiE [Prolixibacteraceae bacterium]